MEQATDKKSVSREIRNAKTQKIRRQNILSIVFMTIVFVGAVGFGVCLLLSEILYTQIENFFECPIWYRIFIFISLVFANGGIVGCAFTKNRHNTTNLECNIELALFVVGFIFELGFALASEESFSNALAICIGGAVSSVGFFCGIGSLIGKLKKPKDVYGKIYVELISLGTLPYRQLPKSATLLQIMQVEKYFNAMLPNELVYFLLEFNGDGELLFSAEEIIDTAKRVRETFRDTTFNGVDKFCFFGGDGAGNYFCYKISDDGSIADGEIYLWYHETNETKLVANRLTDLIVEYYNDVYRL